MNLRVCLLSQRDWRGTSKRIAVIIRPVVLTGSPQQGIRRKNEWIRLGFGLVGVEEAVVEAEVEEPAVALVAELLAGLVVVLAPVAVVEVQRTAERER